jgi:hypothetical protein
VLLKCADKLWAQDPLKKTRKNVHISLFVSYSSSALMYGQGLLMIIWRTCKFCHIGLQALTTEISSFMICHCQSDYGYGTCMMVLRHIIAVLCEMFSVTGIMADG